MSHGIQILILAAGASSRMRGEDKLVRDVDGIPLLRRCTLTALATGAPVLVALSPDPARQAVISDLPVTRISVPDAALGMSRSLVRGVAALTDGGCDGVMILPADMPDFTADALSQMIAAFSADPQRIFRGGSEDGTPGHPAIFPRAYWPELAQVTGDEGGRSVLRRHADRTRLIRLPGRMAVTDLDTPEDWAAWLGGPAISG